MSNKQVIKYSPSSPYRGRVLSAIYAAIGEWMTGGQDFEVEVREPRRTLDANACMWATLTDIANQREWAHTNAAGEWVAGKISREAWKAIYTAAFEQETRMVAGLEGGVVMLGARTREYSKRKMGELIEFVHADAVQAGVKFSVRARDELAWLLA